MFIHHSLIHQLEWFN